MRVIVEAVSGPGKGRNLTLKPGDVIVIGRTEWSDVCIGADQQMSARHFSIESGQNGLRLIDQGSTNGTQVNGEFIKEAPLYDGDQIVAGTTTFRVRMEQAAAPPTGAPPTAVSPTGSPFPGGTPNPGATPPSAKNPFGESKDQSPYAPVEIGGAGPLGPPDMMQSGGNPFDDQVVYTGDSGSQKQAPLPRDNPIYFDEGPTSVEPQSKPPYPPSSGSGRSENYDSPIVMDDEPPASAGPATPTPAGGETPFGQETPFGASAQASSTGSSTPPSVGSTPASGVPKPAAPNSPFAEPVAPTPVESGNVTPPPRPGEPWSGGAPTRPVGQPPSGSPVPPPPPPGYGEQPTKPTAAASAATPTPAAGNPPPRSDFVMAEPVQDPAQRAQPVYDTSRKITPATPEMMQFSLHPCKSELVKCLRSNYGDAPVEFKPSSVMAQLKRQLPLITLLHFQKGGLEYPQDLSDATPLLHWLPDESARNFGPVLVPQTDQLDRLETVDALWDTDSAVCIYARDVEGATTHLKKLLRYNMNGPNDEEGMFGYCWPSVIGNLLECQSDEIVKVVFGDILDFVFIEVGGKPGHWQIFGSDETVALMKQLGFTEVPLEESAKA